MASSVFINLVSGNQTFPGNVTVGGVLYKSDGTVLLPSDTYTLDTDLGSYRIGANNEGFSAGGALVFDYNASRVLFAQPILAPDGAAGTPGFSFGSDPDSGFYKTGLGAVALALDGVGRFRWGTNYAMASDTELQWLSTTSLATGNPDTILVRDAANTLAQRNGTNAQFSYLYATSAASNANYERMESGFDGTSFFIKGGAKGGTGTSRGFNVGTAGNTVLNFVTNDTSRWTINAAAGHLIAFVDNTYDIGASAATRPRTGYFGTSVISPLFTSGSTTLVTTSATLTNGAAAQAGTLLNAPTAGNPTKWIPVNDNGTTRYVPAW